MVILFILFFCLFTFIELFGLKSIRTYILFLSCAILSILTGFRSFQWPDTSNYVLDFQFYTYNLFKYSLSDTATTYSDKGFYFLSTVIKTFTSDSSIYLFLIAILTFFFIYKSLKKYCVFPLIGLCCYISRFILTRNMMQIRAALAIAIVIYALQYISTKNWKSFFICIIIGASLHISVLLAIPLYWMNCRWLNKKNIFYITLGTTLFMIFFSTFIIDRISYLSFLYNVATAYTSQSSEYTHGMGVTNPMIFFQIAILFLFTWKEKTFSSIVPYYKVLRNGYFYSTFLLILLSTFGVLSGRISTIYATFEIFIIPSFIYLLKPKFRVFAFIGIGVVLVIIFYLNYQSATLLKMQ